jgi:hypothetical protein
MLVSMHCVICARVGLPMFSFLVYSLCSTSLKLKRTYRRTRNDTQLNYKHDLVVKSKAEQHPRIKTMLTDPYPISEFPAVVGYLD